MSENPDILSFLANLGSDEVFTPPNIANQMLDILPKECWANPDVKFLDPCCKSGVFLREINKRLLVGLQEKIPILQERVNHVCQNQLYGIATTELTALLSRRSLYCSKYANGKYSICTLQNFRECGNVVFTPQKHNWENGYCNYCRVNKNNFDRSDDLESYAYWFIHTLQPREIFRMKFDVIIGNPPYQMETGGPGHHARPIYNLFVEQAKKLNPRYLIMIIPSRWFAGGMGLDQFRKDMLSDRRIKKIVDFPNAKDCFPENSISGGVCYFLWDREYDGDCEVVNIRKNTDNGKDISRTIRSLSEFDSIFVRYNDAVSIIRKVLAINGESISSMVSPTDPFGIETYVRGESNTSSSSITLHSSKGHGFISKSKISKGKEYLDKYKVLISCIGSEHAVEPGNDGKFSIISGSMEVIGPKEVCTGSYIIIPAESHEIAENIAKYLRTKFVRFLVLQALTSIHLTKSTFKFVPVQDFNESWTDSKLYNKYKLTNEEINFIENMIRPFNERKK